ncbi:MAG: CIA30 family protein [Cyanobacteria bacterium P01_D01_bin.105]
MANSRTSNSRTRWDARRFLQTLGYFGEVPFLGSFRWLQQWTGQNTVVSGMTMTASKKRVAIMGDRLSTDLLSALKMKLASTMELTVIRPDVTRTELIRLVRPVDTVVLLDSQAIDAYLSGLRKSTSKDLDAPSFWQALSEPNTRVKQYERIEQSVFNFADPTCDISAWGALDDVVMGGVSEGSFFLRRADNADTPSQCAVFTGNVSTDNSGGFSSVRTQNFEPPFDFSGWTGMRLWVKGDGQRYKFILRNSGGWDSPAYIYSFDTVADKWQEVCISFEAMVPTFRAKSVPDAPKLDPQKVFSFQLMLSKFEYDKRLNSSFVPGPFELSVADISLYRPRQGTPLLWLSAEETEVRNHNKAALEAASLSYRLIEMDAAASNEARVERLVEALG